MGMCNPTEVFDAGIHCAALKESVCRAPEAEVDDRALPAGAEEFRIFRPEIADTGDCVLPGFLKGRDRCTNAKNV